MQVDGSREDAELEPRELLFTCRRLCTAAEELLEHSQMSKAQVKEPLSSPVLQRRLRAVRKVRRASLEGFGQTLQAQLERGTNVRLCFARTFASIETVSHSDFA